MKKNINCRRCLTRRQADPGTNPVLINHVVLPTQCGPSTSHLSASSNSAQATAGETRTSFEIRPIGNEAKLFTMNGAPPAYKDSIQFPVCDMASLPAYDDVCDSLPAYEEDEL